MSDIRNEIKRGVIWNSLLAFLGKGIAFLSTIILAHLLEPEVYGLMGMMAIFISVSETLMDAGLGGALIKKHNATTVDYSTLLVFNLVVSLALYGAIFIIAPFVAAYYSEPILTRLLRLYSIVIIIEAFYLSPRIKLIKELKFKEYALSSILSAITGLVVAVVLASLGFGIYSLIFQPIAGSAVFAIIVLIITRYHYSFRFSWESFREMFRFGFDTTIASTLKNASENIVVNSVARVAPLKQAGYYNQSYKLQNIVASVISTVIDNGLFPILSKEQDDKIISYSQKINHYAIFLATTAFFVLFQNAYLVVYALLGNKWTGMVDYFQILLLAGIFQMYTALNRNVFKTLAKTSRIVRIELISSMSLILLPVSMRYGINYIIANFVLYVLIRWLLSAIYLSKEMNVGVFSLVKGYISNMYIPLVAFVVTLCMNFGLGQVMDNLLRTIMMLFVIWLLSKLTHFKTYEELEMIILNKLRK